MRTGLRRAAARRNRAQRPAPAPHHAAVGPQEQDEQELSREYDSSATSALPVVLCRLVVDVSCYIKHAFRLLRKSTNFAVDLIRSVTWHDVYHVV